MQMMVCEQVIAELIQRSTLHPEELWQNYCDCEDLAIIKAGLSIVGLNAVVSQEARMVAFGYAFLTATNRIYTYFFFQIMLK